MRWLGGERKVGGGEGRKGKKGKKGRGTRAIRKGDLIPTAGFFFWVSGDIRPVRLWQFHTTLNLTGLNG